MNKRIAIDMQGALTNGSRPRGIGRYTLNLVSAMIRLRGGDIHLLMNDAFHAEAAATREQMAALDAALTTSLYRVPTTSRYSESGSSPRRVIADAIVRRHVAHVGADVLLATSLFETAPPDYRPIDLGLFSCAVTVAIVYDLIPLAFRDVYLTDKAATRSYLENIKALTSADLLLAISESAKRDAMKYLNLPAERIAVIDGAADAQFAPMAIEAATAERVRNRYGLSRSFVMYVAGGDHRKNLRGVAEAVATMPARSRRELQILLVTTVDPDQESELIEAARTAGLGHDSLVIAGKVSDDDLVALLNMSLALVFPSRYEGFGLPVLEAMQCGTPVVVAATSSLPEIVDRSDLLFDPDRPQEAGRLLHRLMTDGEFRAEVSRWGIERAKRFSWERTARLALEAIAAARIRSTRTDHVALRNELLDLDGARRAISDALRLVPAEDPYVGSFVADLLFSVPRFKGGGQRLLIDATQCARVEAWTGIQRVVRKLTAAFYRGGIDRADVIPLAVRLDGDLPEAATGHVALSLGRTDIAKAYEVEIRPGDDLLMLDSNWEHPETFPALFARVRRCGGRVFTCVYDLIPELHPEVCIDIMPGIHSRWLRAAVAGSDGLICISQAVADELLSYIRDNDLPHRPGLKIGWFHCGSDIDSFHSVKPVRDEVRAAFSGEVPTFLAVGTLEPRKCHALALDAFDLLWAQESDARLVFVGGRGWKIDALADRIRSHPQHGKRLFWFEGVSDNDVSHAYERTTAVVSMSMAEGFGLPLAEAARLDKPVICSDIPVFREVGGEGAVYFASDDAASMAEAVQDWLAGRRQADPTKVSRTTWKEAARRIGQVIYDEAWYEQLP